MSNILGAYHFYFFLFFSFQGLARLVLFLQEKSWMKKLEVLLLIIFKVLLKIDKLYVILKKLENGNFDLGIILIKSLPLLSQTWMQAPMGQGEWSK